MSRYYRDLYDIAVIGNGTPSDNLSDVIKEIPAVVRFDAAETLHTAAVGTRTSVWIISERAHLNRNRDIPTKPVTYQPELKGLALFRDLHKDVKGLGMKTSLGNYLASVHRTSINIRRVALIYPGNLPEPDMNLVRKLEAEGMRVFT